jgi:hypothetical protein
LEVKRPPIVKKKGNKEIRIAVYKAIEAMEEV